MPARAPRLAGPLAAAGRGARRADPRPAPARGRGARVAGSRRGAARTFERRWRHGGSAALRPLVDAGTVELLGGPATHPVLPLLPEPAGRCRRRGRPGRRGGPARPATARASGSRSARSAPGLQDVLAGGGRPPPDGRGGDAARGRAGHRPALVVGRRPRRRPRPRAHRPGVVVALRLPVRAGLPGLPPPRRGLGLPGLAGRPTRPVRTRPPLRPRPGRGGRAPRRRGVRRRGAGPAARPAPARRAAARGGRVGHRAVRPLVARRPAVPRARAADAARGRRPARDAGPGRRRAGGRARPEVELPAGSWGHGKDLRLWAGPAVADLRPTSRRWRPSCLSAVRPSARPGARRATAGWTRWRARRCCCTPATGPSWCRGTARPATRGTGTTGHLARVPRPGRRHPPAPTARGATRSSPDAERRRAAPGRPARWRTALSRTTA